MLALHRDRPLILGPLPGPKAQTWLERDKGVMSPSYTRSTVSPHVGCGLAGAR